MITKTKLKATGFFPPYSKEGSYNLKTKNGKGCYIIRKNGKTVYVGMSLSDIQGTLYRHFQKWTDRRTAWTKKQQNYERVTYYGQDRSLFTVKIIFCPTDHECYLLESLLIKKLRPADNTLKNELYHNAELDRFEPKLENVQAWKPISDEPPF